MAPRGTAEEDYADSEVASKKVKIDRDAQPVHDGTSTPISRSRSPTVTHDRRFLCPATDCASGANDAAGLRKHLKTQHEDYKIPKVLDDFSVSWMSWARGDFATHPPTGQAKTAYLESSQSTTQPSQLLRLRLALKSVVPPTPSMSEDGDAADSDADYDEAQPTAKSTVPRIKEPVSAGSDGTHDIIIVEVPPTPSAPTAATTLQAPPDNSLLTSRLRSSRNPTPISSRAPSRATSRASSRGASRASSRAPPTRKPRKPTKESMLNGRLEFQKSRTWQIALSVAVEGLSREEGPEVVPTERERVFAKRIERDATRIRELEAEVRRLEAVVLLQGLR